MPQTTTAPARGPIPTEFDVVGVGNALVDVIAHVDDVFLDHHELVRGSMALVDTDRALHLYRSLGTAVQMSGGSAANTMTGIASFGGRAAYVGKVADDDLGQVPHALVQTDAAIDEDAVIAFVGARVASYKVPRTVVFTEVPKTSTGKIQKFKLREMAKNA